MNSDKSTQNSLQNTLANQKLTDEKIALNDRLDNRTLELLAEKAQVAVERITTGQIKLSKVIKTETVNVPVTLTQEVLIIEHTATPNTLSKDERVQVVTNPVATKPTILVDDKPVTLSDKPVEIVLSQQIAKIAIETQVAEQVKLVTTRETHEQSIPVTLRHEELVMEEVKLDNPTVLSSQVVNDATIQPK